MVINHDIELSIVIFIKKHTTMVPCLKSHDNTIILLSFYLYAPYMTHKDTLQTL